MTSRFLLVSITWVAAVGCDAIQPTPSTTYECYLEGYAAGSSVVSEYSYETYPPREVDRRAWGLGFHDAVGSGPQRTKDELDNTGGEKASTEFVAFRTPSRAYETYLDGYAPGLNVVSEYSYETDPPRDAGQRIWQLGFDDAVADSPRRSEEDLIAWRSRSSTRE